ncbi:MULTISPECIES: alpha-ketoglutarate-dependent dioxygenase AlkB family protein [Flavobacterium]|uniref:Alpha-ketoglutarate-dependent dioxygenase AlkB n=1 Tax=Flavobacterium salmonis TaxID=2654844 RepID=A0A6V6Z818_9FLAO|nr:MULTISPECIES: alpha-ketoglutarate-dependent dioxygenase AlkB [Flavobacterium]OOV19173.1 alpha-ketoglutarate-dependent dioxygenase AlkB [Flavobacterium sp. LM4]CAD0007646.1 alpha-ketoglutarate-dependent dioxygenase AlkB [Flavobacterium salmonis]
MRLFNDTELFSTGTGGKKVFDVPDADLLLIDNFFTKQESDYYYDKLLNETQWQEYDMPMYDKIVTAPRMVSWYRDDDLDECHPHLNWPLELQTIRQRVENETQIQFNAVLLNLYRNGKDGVGWHSDKTVSSNKNMNIASVTFGETRMFRLRHKFRKEIPQLEIPLHHGSFLLMAGNTNSFWQHQIPKTAREVLPRINLTFRKINRKE